MCLPEECVKYVYECLEKKQTVAPIRLSDVQRFAGLRSSVKRRKRIHKILSSPMIRNGPRFHAKDWMKLQASAAQNHLMSHEQDQDEYLEMEHEDQDPDSPEQLYIPGMQNWSILTHTPQYPYYEAPESQDSTEPKWTFPRARESPDTELSSPYREWFMNNTNCTESYFHNMEDIRATITGHPRHDGEHDVVTTYLGPSRREGLQPFLAEPTIRLTDLCWAQAQLPSGSKAIMLFDTGACTSLMSKTFYMSHEELQHLPKYSVNLSTITVGNGQTITVMFAIPVVIEIQGHLFEIYFQVLDIRGITDIVMGIKNMKELEGIVNTRTSTFDFMNRSLPLFPQTEQVIKPGEKIPITLHTPFRENLSGYAIVKAISGIRVITLKCKITNNTLMVEIENTNPDRDLILSKEKTIAILDLRSMGYFHVPAMVLMSAFKEYHFEDAHMLCQTFNKMMQGPKHASPDPYPWLEADDYRRHLTDNQILDKLIDLSRSDLHPKEKKTLIAMCKKYREAFSLRDEVGECPKIRIHIEVHDKSPFFVRPFGIAEDDKEWMDWQMERLVHLGILSKKSTSHTSPVMLISRKLTTDKRLVVDFRFLNSRVVRRNTTTPLMRDIFATLGRSQVECMSCIDFKDAYHSLRLDEESKEYCGIVPYFGAPCYRYERMPQGLSISPAMWMEYVNLLLQNVSYRQNYIAIMDDLLLFGKRHNHMQMIEDLLQNTVKHGLKMSPKKCQFFVTELIYMGSKFTLADNRITIQPLKDRCEAIQNLQAPRTPKECKMFCGTINFLSMFCPKASTSPQAHLWTDPQRYPFCMGIRSPSHI